MKPGPPSKAPSLPVDGEPLQPGHPLDPLPWARGTCWCGDSLFGIVTTGFNFGGMEAPIVGGLLLDHHTPALIFYGSAAFLLLTVVIAVSVDRSAGLKVKG